MNRQVLRVWAHQNLPHKSLIFLVLFFAVETTSAGKFGYERHLFLNQLRNFKSAHIIYWNSVVLL